MREKRRNREQRVTMASFHMPDINKTMDPHVLISIVKKASGQTDQILY